MIHCAGSASRRASCWTWLSFSTTPEKMGRMTPVVRGEASLASSCALPRPLLFPSLSSAFPPRQQRPDGSACSPRLRAFTALTGVHDGGLVPSLHTCCGPIKQPSIALHFVPILFIPIPSACPFIVRDCSQPVTRENALNAFPYPKSSHSLNFPGTGFGIREPSQSILRRPRGQEG